MGRKKQPHYRIVVAESEFARDGRFVESLGFYKPLSQPARLVVDLERVDHWIGLGAQPSDTVRSLINKARRGGDEGVAVGEVDVQAARAKRSEMLADRRTAERKKADAKPTVVPQDVAETTGGSSASDATAAEAMAESEARSEPDSPPESIAKAAGGRGSKKKGKPAEEAGGE
jgi:small subunit ribosomal protein S16